MGNRSFYRVVATVDISYERRTFEDTIVEVEVDEDASDQEILDELIDAALDEVKALISVEVQEDSIIKELHHT